MESTSFNLPKDPDQKKVAAASLTAAVCSLLASDFPEDAALAKVHQIYTNIESPPRSLSEWVDND